MPTGFVLGCFTELSLIKNLHQGWFSVVLVPTSEHDNYRWHIFAYNSVTEKVELTTIRASAEGLFDVQDYTVMEAKPEVKNALVPRSIPGIIQRSLDLGDIQVANGFSATKYDLQKEKQTKDGMQLLKDATKVMLAIPTQQGTGTDVTKNVAAISFSVAADGTLSQIDENPDHTNILRSNSRDLLLPLNTLDEIKGIGDSTPPPQGKITAVERGEEDRVKITFTSADASKLETGKVVKITDTKCYNGHYVAKNIDVNSFEIEASYVNGDIGCWEVVPEEETGLIFDGAITAFERVTDHKLRVTAVNHGLEAGDEVQIIDTTDYNRTCGIEKIDDEHFLIDGIRWEPGEAVNLKLESRKRRGVMFNGSDEYIAIPKLELTPPSTEFAFGYTVSAWVFVPARGSGEQLIVGDTDQLMRLLVQNDKVTLRVNFTRGFQDVEDPNPLPENEWVHYGGMVAYDRQSTKLTLCRNGQQIAHRTVQKSFPTMAAALNFDGVSDYIQLAAMNLDLSQGFTVESWVYYDDFKNWSRIIDFANGEASDNIILGNTENSNGLRLSVYKGGTRDEIERVNVLETDQWIHLAATVDSKGKARLFKNGIVITRGEIHLPNKLNRANNYIAKSNWSNDDYFDGKLAEVRIWKRARTQDEIQRDMNRRLSGSEAGLVGYWCFEGGSVKDYSPKQNHCTIHGNPQRVASPFLQRLNWKPEFEIGKSFAGKIADVQIWDKARTAKEIKDSMYLQLTGREVDLVGYWRLGAITEDKKRKVVDFSVNGNDGIVHGDAFVSAITLNRKLGDNKTQVVKYSNDELVAVTARATYVETFEFKTDPNVDPNNVGGNKLFSFSYWGKKSRSSEEKITFSETDSDFESLDNNWYKATCRFTVPDGVAMMRTFELGDVEGTWSTLEIRKHRVKLVSDSITEVKYTDNVNLSTLADQYSQLPGQLKTLEQKEQQEVVLLKEKKQLELKIASLSLSESEKQAAITAKKNQINSQQTIINNLPAQITQCQKTYNTEQQNPLNYWCKLVCLENEAWIARIYTASKGLLYAPLGADGNPYYSNNKFKFVATSGGFYRIVSMYDNLALHGEVTKQVYGGTGSGPEYEWKLKPIPGGYYVIMHRGSNEVLDRGGSEYGVCIWEYNETAHQFWKIIKIGGESNNNISNARKAWETKQAELRRAQNILKTLQDELKSLQLSSQERSANKTQLEARLREVISELKEVQSSLDILNTNLLNEVRNTQVTSQTMHQVAISNKGLVTKGALLGFASPATRITAIETCEGNVQLSYFDANAKLPVDPRIMERFESMANDAQLPAQTRQQAKDFLARNKDNICLIVRNIADKERLQQKYQDKYKIINAQNAPYTGNTAPQYGNKLEGQSAYADVIQEMFVTKPTAVSPGAKIYAKFPREGVDPERADLPAGSEQIAIAEWDGTQWKVIASDRELQENFKRTLAKYPDSVKQQWQKKTFDNQQLGEWEDAGKQKVFLEAMQQRYEADFVKQLSQASNGAIDAEKAKTYFKDFSNSLYKNRIPGLGKGYGAFSEERRQELVDSFAEEVSGVITSLGKVAAQGQTFLWSDARIGMFAAAERDIREAAGVLGAGQSLEQTNIGKLWNKLEVIQKPDEALGLNWDRSSQVWNSISKEFAANATGDVHVFLPKDIGALSIFWNVELPELRKRMSPFTDSPAVTNITIHHPTDQALTQLREIDSNNDLTQEQKQTQKRSLMTVSSNWESEDIMDASFQVQRISEKQKEAIRKTANPWSVGLMEVMTERDKARKSITLNKLRDMGNKWRFKDNFPKVPQELEKYVKKNRSKLRDRLKAKVLTIPSKLRRLRKNKVVPQTTASNN